MSILSIKNLEKRYGENIILNDVSADIEKGDVIAIIGPSGTGKSTFLRAVNFLDPPTSGEVYFNGEKLTKKNVDDVRKKMVMVFQNFGLFRHLDVVSNLTIGQIKLLGLSKHEAEKKSLELLKTVGLSERANYMPGQLSGGQKQRVAIARCLAMSPEMILFDEPTSALDPTMVGEVMAVIRNLAKSGMSMLVVTHEMDFAKDVSNRVFYMDEGGIYEDGKPDEIFSSPRKEKTKNFIYNIRSFTFEVKHRDFDFAQMLSGVQNFCFNHAVDKKMTQKLQLISEKLVINIIVPKYDACILNINISEKLGTYEFSVSYDGEKSNVLDNPGDELAAKLVKNIPDILIYDYLDGKNIIHGSL